MLKVADCLPTSACFLGKVMPAEDKIHRFAAAMHSGRWSGFWVSEDAVGGWGHNSRVKQLRGRGGGREASKASGSEGCGGLGGHAFGGKAMIASSL